MASRALFLNRETARERTSNIPNDRPMIFQTKQRMMGKIFQMLMFALANSEVPSAYPLGRMGRRGGDFDQCYQKGYLIPAFQVQGL